MDYSETDLSKPTLPRYVWADMENEHGEDREEIPLGVAMVAVQWSHFQEIQSGDRLRFQFVKRFC